MSRLDPELRQVLLEMRDLLKTIRQEIMHLIELCRFDLSVSTKRRNDR
jgi:hypothetical protein